MDATITKTSVEPVAPQDRPRMEDPKKHPVSPPRVQKSSAATSQSGQAEKPSDDENTFQRFSMAKNGKMIFEKYNNRGKLLIRVPAERHFIS